MSATLQPPAAQYSADPHAAPPMRRAMPHALVMMLLIIVAAVALTYVVPSGEYTRDKQGLVAPGSFHAVPKDYGGALSLSAPHVKGVAYPAPPAAIVSSIPAGMVKSASLIFMILFIGGMFGVLQATGALEAGVERLLVRTRGNVSIVVPVVMIVLAAGSSFLGLISEYLVIIPMALLLAERLGYDALFGTAIVTIAAKIGYLTSVTNPLALAVAQPIVGVPVFSGVWFRVVTLVVMLPIGIVYLLRRRAGMVVGEGRGPSTQALRAFARDDGERGALRAVVARDDGERGAPRGHPERSEGSLGHRDVTPPLSVRHMTVLVVLLGAIALMMYGVEALKWSNNELAAMYIAVALAIAVVGRVPSRDASQAFIKGMQGMVLAGILVGLASAVEVILRDGMILDSIVAFLTRSVEGKPPVIVANLMMFMQMVIDVFIPSTSGKAAVTMPILGPIGHLSGVTGQVTVQAFLFGNGLMNTLTPTSGMLLAYLATGRVSYGRWIRFILPLALILVALSMVAITAAVIIGY